MEEKKKSKVLVCLIVILIILILVLVGYIVYDKVFSGDNNLNNQNISTTVTNITDDSNFDNLINKIIMKNRIKDYEFVEEETKTFDYEFKCIEEDTECVIPNFVINNVNYELGPNGNVYLFNKYVIIKSEGGDGFSGDITVVNQEGKKLYYERYVGTYCDNFCEYFGIQGDEEKIYFIVKENSDLILKSIDLKNNLKVEDIASSNKYTQAG